MDENGKLQVVGKERGRKKSLNKIVDMAVEQIKGWDNDIAMITHGDCQEDAEYVAKLVRERLGIENILINNIGTCDRQSYRTGSRRGVCDGKQAIVVIAVIEVKEKKRKGM